MNKKITDLTSLNATPEADDLLYIVDSSEPSATASKKISVQNLSAFPSVAIRESAGPTDLTVGAIADGEYLRRVGTTVVGATPSGGSPGGSDGQIQYRINGSTFGGGPLHRSGADTVEQHNGTTPQTARWYRTRTDASNGEWLEISFPTAPSGTWARIGFTGNGTGGANLSVAITPRGEGALSAQVPDDTVAGGNARGQYATDWQRLRDDASQVASGDYSTIGGGRSNAISGYGIYCTIGGGVDNTISGEGSYISTIGGGVDNTISGYGSYSTIGGGVGNETSGYASKIGGGSSNSASGDYSTIAGGNSNSASGYASTIAGGNSNSASGYASTIGGGNSNSASGEGSTIGGGNYNTAGYYLSTIGGGDSNTASGYASTIGGGYVNTASDGYSTIGGGNANTASGYASTIGGGDGNTASGSYSWIPGGSGAVASEIYGAYAWASTFRAAYGDAQRLGLPAQLTTTNATPTVLTSDRGEPSTANVLVLPNNSAWSGIVQVLARSTSGATAKWTIDVLAKRGANAASMTIVDSHVIRSFAEAALSTASVSIVADTTRGAATVEVTGVADTEIDWWAEFFGGQVVR